MRKKMILGLFVLAFVSPSFALDKDAFADHLRKAFNIDNYVPISVGDPVPSQFEGFLSLPVSFGPQKQSLLISKDERFYIWGSVMDRSIDPDKDRMSKLDFSKSFYKGSKTAPVTIVEFSDLQCPNCQKGHVVLDEKLFKDYPNNQVRLIFKHYPLSMHDWAEPASVAAECAGQQGNDYFWKMVDKVYGKIEEINVKNVAEKTRKFSEELKLDATKFKACVESPLVLEKIRKDKQEGAAVGVNATPSFLVNGRLIRGNRYDDMKLVIDEKLKAAKTKK
jgi:protein-disulfide isomerase